MTREGDSRAARAERAKAALAKLKRAVGKADWCTGVAIVPAGAKDLALRVSVGKAFDAQEAGLPDVVDGFPVHVLGISGYRARSATQPAPRSAAKGATKRKKSAKVSGAKAAPRSGKGRTTR